MEMIQLEEDYNESAFKGAILKMSVDFLVTMISHMDLLARNSEDHYQVLGHFILVDRGAESYQFRAKEIDQTLSMIHQYWAMICYVMALPWLSDRGEV